MAIENVGFRTIKEKKEKNRWGKQSQRLKRKSAGCSKKQKQTGQQKRNEVKGKPWIR